MDREGHLYTFGIGENYHLQDFLGAHEAVEQEQGGYYFRVWAPNAEKVEIIGDFTGWYDCPLLLQRHVSGVWEGYSPYAQEGQIYKCLITRQGGQVIEKIDPFARYLEHRPSTGAILQKISPKKWKDNLWIGRRRRFGFKARPVSIYEVHAGSWKTDESGEPYSFARLTEELVPYLVAMNYTHVELLPLMAHPLGLSWGYQLMGYFAFEHTYGTPEEFKQFVEACHLHNIGVILDWVPGHFTQNDDALAYYDGTPTFEYQDPNRANNQGWGALNFDLGKKQVQSFLISSILYWIEEFHIDGIRVDAVTNMLYLDFDQGPWTPNQYGDNRNLEGIAFLKKMIGVVKSYHPDVMLIAEESSSDIPITKPIEEGGLGFDFKWNLGWMNDILRFYQKDPIHRKHVFNLVTFSFMYCFNENYILPFSHDEVVHGKKSMMHKMWGDRYQQFAGLRNLYTYQMFHPGKKLLFMGSEFGQFLEWKSHEQLEWHNLDDPLNHQMQLFTRQLNRFYKEHRALWEIDDSYDGLRIIDADNTDETVLTLARQSSKGELLIGIFNMTPVERHSFTIGVPVSGIYEEVLNSELISYGGTWESTNLPQKTVKQKWKDYHQTLTFTLPALGASIWRLKRRRK